MGFNINQLEAIAFRIGRCAVIAGPGSGKTTVIIERIIQMIKENTLPERILVFTFTNKACNEIKKRLRERLGYLPKVEVTTFHSYAFKFILSLYNKEIRNKIRPLLESHSKEIIRKLCKQYEMPFKDSDVYKIFSSMRNKFNVRLDEKLRLKYIFLYYKYKEFCADNYYLDFDDMIYQFVNMVKENDDLRIGLASSYDYIMVDECQDINNIQYEMLMLLESECESLFMVGDPDQGIYEWRGSNVDLLQDFVNRLDVHVIELNENYRSDKNIVLSTSYMIGRNKKRIDRKLIPMNPAVNDIKFNFFTNAYEEADFVAASLLEHHKNGMNYSDTLVLQRRNDDSEFLEIALKRYGIPYKKDVLSFFDYEVNRTINMFYNLILNHDDNMAFEYVITRPACGIKKKKIDEIATTKNISLFQAAKQVNDTKTQLFVSKIEELTELIKVTEPMKFYDILLSKMQIPTYRKFLTDDSKQHFDTFRSLMANVTGPDYLEGTRNYLNDVLFVKDNPITNDVVRIMTVHQAKGLEADVVYYISMVEGYWVEDVSEEERRINYVGTTRAKQQLYCSGYGSKYVDSNQNYRESIHFKELKYGQYKAHHQA